MLSTVENEHNNNSQLALLINSCAYDEVFWHDVHTSLDDEETDNKDYCLVQNIEWQHRQGPPLSKVVGDYFGRMEFDYPPSPPIRKKRYVEYIWYSTGVFSIVSSIVIPGF